ncbi:MAG: hypothetical protein PHS33_08200 [Candidatus Omnitrophica bacterium]|nr:hypothetical protein [Candidatus Omnitrophota bacterium]
MNENWKSPDEQPPDSGNMDTASIRVIVAFQYKRLGILSKTIAYGLGNTDHDGGNYYWSITPANCSIMQHDIG